MPLVPMPEFKGHSAEAVVALGSVPPEEALPGTAGGAHVEAAEAYVAFANELEKIADNQHLTPAGRVEKRLEAARKGLDQLEGLNRSIARSESTLAEHTAAIEKAISAIDVEEVRSWRSYWTSIEGGSGDRVLKARQAISDGDVTMVASLLRQPRVLSLLTDDDRNTGLDAPRDDRFNSTALDHHTAGQNDVRPPEVPNRLL